jgi:hypothetical protein
MKFTKTSVLLVALCAMLAVGTAPVQARSGRELQQANMFDLLGQGLPGLNLLPLNAFGMPSLTDFLPPLSEINLPPIDEFLNMTGLPSWNQLGLPPLSDLLKPMGDINQPLELPSVNEILTRANETMTQVIAQLLPAGIKLPPLPALDLTKLPQMLNLPSLDDILAGLSGLSNLPALPGLPAGLPALGDLVKAVTPLADALKAMPPIDLNNLNAPITLPSLDELLMNLPPLPQDLPDFGTLLNLASGLLKLIPTSG